MGQVVLEVAMFVALLPGAGGGTGGWVRYGMVGVSWKSRWLIARERKEVSGRENSV